MTSTIVPRATVITHVKIDKDKKTGWYILRSQELGKMAAWRDREVLRRIADAKGWAVVKAWA